MTETYRLTIEVEVSDPADLYQAALQQALQVDGMLVEAATELLGTAECPDVPGCLMMLGDPGVSWPGTQIVHTMAAAV